MFVFKIHFKPFQVIFEKTSTAKFLGAAQKEKGRVCNCILHASSWKLTSKIMELHASLWNHMQANGTACKLKEMYVSFCKCMQAHGTACNFREHTDTDRKMGGTPIPQYYQAIATGIGDWDWGWGWGWGWDWKWE